MTQIDCPICEGLVNVYLYQEDSGAPMSWGGSRVKTWLAVDRIEQIEGGCDCPPSETWKDEIGRIAIEVEEDREPGGDY